MDIIKLLLHQLLMFFIIKTWFSDYSAHRGGSIHEPFCELLGIKAPRIQAWFSKRLLFYKQSFFDIKYNRKNNVGVITINKYLQEINYISIQEQKRRRRYNNFLLSVEIIVGICSVLIILGSLFIATFINLSEFEQTCLIVFGMIIGWTGVIICLFIEQKSENYECEACKHRYIPSFLQIFWSKDINRKRFMKCPMCGEKTWNKKTEADAFDKPLVNKKALLIEIVAIIVLVAFLVVLILTLLQQGKI